MKILQLMALTLFMTGCADAQSTTTTAKLKTFGEPLPIDDNRLTGWNGKDFILVQL